MQRSPVLKIFHAFIEIRLLERFLSEPKDFTYDKLRRLLRTFGY